MQLAFCYIARGDAEHRPSVTYQFACRATCRHEDDDGEGWSFACTLRAGHDGDHASHSFGAIVATWPRELQSSEVTHGR